jgi:hypothetical protein
MYENSIMKPDEQLKKKGGGGDGKGIRKSN